MSWLNTGSYETIYIFGLHCPQYGSIFQTRQCISHITLHTHVSLKWDTFCHCTATNILTLVRLLRPLPSCKLATTLSNPLYNTYVELDLTASSIGDDWCRSVKYMFELTFQWILNKMCPTLQSQPSSRDNGCRLIQWAILSPARSVLFTWSSPKYTAHPSNST